MVDSALVCPSRHQVADSALRVGISFIQAAWCVTLFELALIGHVEVVVLGEYLRRYFPRVLLLLWILHPGYVSKIDSRVVIQVRVISLVRAFVITRWVLQRQQL